MDILNLFSPDEFKHFLLILLRVSIILFLFPIFGSRVIPVLAKAGLSLVMSLCLYSHVYADPLLFPDKAVMAPIVIISEFFIGLCLAIGVRLFFASVQVAGVVAGFQIGFSMINVVDPQSGSQVSVMDQITFWVVLVIFLIFNGHHVMIKGLVESFQIMPIGKSFYFDKGLFDMVIQFGSDIFSLALKIGAPIIASLFFTSVAFGIVSKFAPQINVMIVAFPVKIVVGLFIFGLMLEVAGYFTRDYVTDFYGIMVHILNFLAGKTGA